MCIPLVIQTLSQNLNPFHAYPFGYFSSSVVDDNGSTYVNLILKLTIPVNR